jgi:hypothetical protein
MQTLPPSTGPPSAICAGSPRRVSASPPAANPPVRHHKLDEAVSEQRAARCIVATGALLERGLP